MQNWFQEGAVRNGDGAAISAGKRNSKKGQKMDKKGTGTFLRS